MLLIKSIVFSLIFIINSVCTYSSDYRKQYHFNEEHLYANVSSNTTGSIHGSNSIDDTYPLSSLNSESVSSGEHLLSSNTTGSVYSGQFAEDALRSLTNSENISSGEHLYENVSPNTIKSFHSRQFADDTYTSKNVITNAVGIILSGQVDGISFLRPLINSENVISNSTGLAHSLQFSDGTCLLRSPNSSAEWNTYHTIRVNEIVKRYCPKDYVYNPVHPDELLSSNFRFVLFHITLQKVVGVIRVDLLEEKGESSIRWVAIEKDHQKQKYGSRMLSLVEKFVLTQNRNLIRVPSAKEAKEFYIKFGFVYTAWEKAPKDDGDVFLSKAVLGS